MFLKYFFAMYDFSQEYGGTFPRNSSDLPTRTYEKLPYKEDPKQFSAQQDSLTQTDKDTFALFY